MSAPLIGFCCKWLDDATQIDGYKPKDAARQYSTQTTTVAWMNRQPKAVAEAKLIDIMHHNVEALYRLVMRVAAMPPHQRMVRLGSDILPLYTHPQWSYFWQNADVIGFLETNLRRVGEVARINGVRLSFHPGQYTVLGSDRPEVVANSIAEFEYHVDIARWMGYGAQWHDHGFKINVHIGGRAGVAGILAVLPQLSPEALNLLTIENDENGYGLDDLLPLVPHVAIVMDIHHHWIRAGEYIQPTDYRVQQVIDSWRGVRPTLHYSVSREDVLVGHDPNTLPDMPSLLLAGHKKSKLRAHSDFMWNHAVTDWALGFAQDFDIQVESKAKNLASQIVADRYQTLNKDSYVQQTKESVQEA